MNDFPWEKINRGYSGFEDLANEYVKFVFSQYNWQPTKRTRDGNHDGYAIISCFSCNIDKYEIWMEAKYSTSNDQLTRYRLDSTIVSAIINQNIRQLFFVTNIEIADYVKHAIRTALIKALHIKSGDIIFCTKQNLEIWLCLPENSTVLKRYFGNINIENINNHKELQIISTPNFYKYIKHQLSYQIPLRKLYASEYYNLYIKVYSPQARDVTITSNSKSLQIFYPQESSIKLQPGCNELALIVKCKPTKSLTNAISINSLIVNLDTITVYKNQKIKVCLHSQQEHIRKIKQALYTFLQQKNSSVHFIWGLSYSGKTFAINNILTDKRIYNEEVLFYTFDMDRLGNLQKLLDLCLKVYFYLFETRDITDEYLTQINTKYDYIPQFIRKLVKHKENNDILPKLIEDLKDVIIFNKDFCTNRKIIVLDGIEHLSAQQFQLLQKILHELYASQTPIFCILSGQGKFLLDLCKFPKIYEHHFTTDFKDCYQTLKINNIQASLAAAFWLHAKLKKLPDLLEFIKYLRIRKKRIYDEFTLIDSYKQFKQNDSYKQYIKHVFIDLEKNKQLECNILHLIYFTISGFCMDAIQDDSHRKAIEYLVEQNLVKIVLGKLLPFNKIYKDVYALYYSTKNNPLISYYTSNLKKEEVLRYNISQNHIEYSLEVILKTIEEYHQEQYFMMIDYLLQPLFCTEYLCDFYKEDLYFYQLKYHYIYALSNTNPDYNSLNAFKCLYEQLKPLNSFGSRALQLRVLAEVVNFAFVDLKVAATFDYIHKFRTYFTLWNQTIAKNVQSGVLLVDEIEILNYAMIDEYELADELLQEFLKKCELYDVDHMGIILQRYARSIFHNNINHAIVLLQDAYEKLKCSKEKKWAKLCLMDIQFAKRLTGELQQDDFHENIDILEENIQTTYKVQLRYQMAYELYRGNLGQFQELYFEYEALKQPHSNRSNGINCLLLAAYYYQKREFTKAAAQLHMQNNAFSTLGQSYKKVIMHNINLVQSSLTINKCLIDFYTKDPLDPNTFYIDPRLW